MPPTISVCIPVRNGGSFFPEAVDSVLGQLSDNDELIIVDNCSTDGTIAWIERNIANVPNVRVYKNSTNIGMVANFNACVAHASGEYIRLLCADDLLLTGSLRRMSNALDADRSVTLVVGGRRLIDENGEPVGTKRYAAKEARILGPEVINRCIFGKNYIGEPSAVMFRKSAAQRGFCESLSHLMNLEMWFHLLEQGSMISLADEVCAIRRHAGQMSEQNIKSGALIEDNVSLLREYGGKPYIRNSWVNRTIRKMRMAYRVWICRNAISADKRDEILAAQSSRLFYYLMMPFLTWVLSVCRKLKVIG